MALIDKLTNIADAIREKTGGTDLLTLDAMAEAIAGMETGGGGASGIYMAKITPAEDLSAMHIEHNLGTTDILMAACWADGFGDTPPSFNGAVANIYLKTSVLFRQSSSVSHENFSGYVQWNSSLGMVNAFSIPTSSSYLIKPTAENALGFPPAGATAAKYFAGVTYTVIVMAASAFSVTEV